MKFGSQEAVFFVDNIGIGNWHLKHFFFMRKEDFDINFEQYFLSKNIHVKLVFHYCVFQKLYFRYEPFLTREFPCAECQLDINPKYRHLLWATSWENLFMPYVNNKGADQPAHPCSLISASTYSKLLWLYRPVRVLLGRKPRRQVFSWCSSYDNEWGPSWLQFFESSSELWVHVCARKSAI